MSRASSLISSRKSRSSFFLSSLFSWVKFTTRCASAPISTGITALVP